MSTTSKRIKSTVRKTVAYDVAISQAEGAVAAPVGTSDNPSDRILTVSNVITFARFCLTMVFLYMFVNHMNRYVALGFYAVAALTDFLDGLIARKTQTVSWVGKIMDPIMDRVLLFTGVLGLMVTGDLPLWIPAFVIGRDLYLAAGGAFLQKYRRRPLDVVYIGKVATALLMCGFCDLLLDVPHVSGLGLVSVSWLPGLNDIPASFGIFLVYAGIVCSTMAAVVYTRRGFNIMHDAIANAQEGVA